MYQIQVYKDRQQAESEVAWMYIDCPNRTEVDKMIRRLTACMDVLFFVGISRLTPFCRIKKPVKS
jgi:hypothetical protein